MILMSKNDLTKPLLRGYFHEVACFIYIGIFILYLDNVKNTQAFYYILIYALSLVTLLGISALYHRPHWNKTNRQRLRKLDHSAIYFLIAGTGTPIAFHGLQGRDFNDFMMIIWGAAVFGILQSLFWINAPKWIQSVIYVGVGLLIVPFFSPLAKTLPKNHLQFIAIGGALYIIGAIIYALKKPNPFPKYFGYHEIFHLLVILAASLHFLVIFQTRWT